MDFTQVDAPTAETFLARCNWSLELAVQEYLNEEEGQPSNIPTQSTTTTNARISSDDSGGNSSEGSDDNNAPMAELRRRHVAAAPPDYARLAQDSSAARRPIQIQHRVAGRPMGWSEWVWQLMLLPLRFSYSTVWGMFRFVYQLVFPAARRPITNAGADVNQFIAEYEEKYGSDHPNFFHGSYADALKEAKKELTFLLVYLHSENHQDTDQFCRQTLSSPEVIQFINANSIFWSCSVKTGEGYRVSMAMRETTYPFFALICSRDSRMMIVLRHEGLCTAGDMLSVLAIAVQDNQTFLNLARQERHEREVNQQLRHEQEVAYQSSLVQDQERQRVQRETLEAAERETAEKAREAAQAEQLQQERERKRDDIKKSLPAEPDQSEDDVVRVNLRFPCGNRFERRFLATDSLGLLHDVCYARDDCPYNFSIVTSYPRKTLQCQDEYGSPLSFAQAGLNKAVMLLVIDNDA